MRERVRVRVYDKVRAMDKLSKKRNKPMPKIADGWELSDVNEKLVEQMVTSIHDDYRMKGG